jgi:hypothetical protein
MIIKKIEFINDEKLRVNIIINFVFLGYNSVSTFYLNIKQNELLNTTPNR